MAFKPNHSHTRPENNMPFKMVDGKVRGDVKYDVYVPNPDYTGPKYNSVEEAMRARYKERFLRIVQGHDPSHPVKYYVYHR